MRIWDTIPCKDLCNSHLLGEHNEVHAIWNTFRDKHTRFYNNPEMKRWNGKFKALYNRHEEQVEEMKRRNFNHKSPLEPVSFTTGKAIQDEFLFTKQQHIDTLRERSLDKNKRCNCKL